MYLVDKDGVKNLNTNELIEMGTQEWDVYKEWCEEGNQPEFGKPYTVPELIVAK
ncbi:hypothetical protein [Heliophilum fasciatum]|uniref:Uncharacterized protein n=1 Tax=Heliophilum fasciatum TaxID=35700 RepID=A0A4R2RQT9_9FIRM|nr:hypothetical protein [Heliophilum fasciatum]MCW2277718.1 hypothetical protein [Heliophilum fasciatum]TCP64787.1 hypothetical protein EDD73_108140 [Heliophilum fasciatum]